MQKTGLSINGIKKVEADNQKKKMLKARQTVLTKEATLKEKIRSVSESAVRTAKKLEVKCKELEEVKKENLVLKEEAERKSFKSLASDDNAKVESRKELTSIQMHYIMHIVTSYGW